MRLQEALHGQPISRRDLLRLAGTTGAGLAGAALLGCGSDEQKPTQIVSGIQPTSPPLLDFRLKSSDNSWKPAVTTGKDGKQYQLTSEYFLPTVKVDEDNLGMPAVAIELTDEGSLLLENLTKNNLNKQLGIFVDNQLISAPVIMGVIPRQEGKPSHLSITGLGKDDTSQLADRLSTEAKNRTGNKNAQNTSAETAQRFGKFRSLNFPYEAELPPGWKYDRQEIDGRKVDILLGETINGFQTNIIVYAEPVASWVRLEDLERDALNNLKKAYQDRPVIFAANHDIKISGQDAFILYSSTIPKSKISPSPTDAFYQQVAVFKSGNKVWYITWSRDVSVRNDTKDRVPEGFRKVLDSFKLLQ